MQSPGADVDGLRPDQPAFAKLLQAMGGPPEDASDGEGRSEQFRRQSQAMQQQCRVKFDIRVQAPVRLVFAEQAQRGRFNAPCQLIEVPIAAARIEALCGLGQDVCARIAHPVDAMSESHQALSPFELGADDGLGALGRADFEDHVERRAGRPAMQRSLERSHRPRDRGDDIGSRRGDDPGRKGGGVEAVIANGVQIGFERPGPLGRWFGAGQLMQVMGRVREIGADRDGRLTVAKPPVDAHGRREGSDGGKSVVERVFLAAEAQKRGRHPQGVHGRRLRGRSLAQNFNGGAGQRAAPGQVLGECNTLRWRRQAALQEQVSDFLKTGLRRQILYRISGQDQLPGLSIHVAEPRRGGYDAF